MSTRQKKFLMCGLILVVACGVVAQAATWTNGTGNQDFADVGNWTGTAGPGTTPTVNMTGSNQAILQSNVVLTATPLYIGGGSTSDSEVDKSSPHPSKTYLLCIKAIS